MTARVYKVTVTVMRESFTRAFVSVYHCAATSRRQAIATIRKRVYTNGADCYHIVAQSLGTHIRTEYRLLTERQA